MKKITILTIILVNILVFVSHAKLYAAASGLEENFNYTATDISIGSTSNYNVYGHTSVDGHNLSITEDGYLLMHATAGSNSSTAQKVQIRDNGGAANLLDQPNSNLLIETSFKFDETYRKTIQLYFQSNQISTSARTLTLLNFTNYAAYYNLGNGDVYLPTSAQEGYFAFAAGETYDLKVVVLDNIDDQDQIYLYINDTLIYGVDLPTDYEFNGQLCELSFSYVKSNSTIDTKWYIDYVKTSTFSRFTTSINDQLIENNAAVNYNVNTAFQLNINKVLEEIDLSAITYSSSDEDVASVDENGYVTIGNDIGNCVITITDGATTISIKLISEKKILTITSDITDIEIELSNKINSYMLAHDPIDATSDILVEVDDESICNVQVLNDVLYIVGYQVGACKVTVYSSDNSEVTLDFNVSIIDSVTDLNVGTGSTIAIGETVSIDASATPSNFNENITYTSKNKTVATVDSTGNVMGVGIGSTTIVVKLGLIEKEYSVTVVEVNSDVLVNELTVSKENVSLNVLEDYKIILSIHPTNYTSVVTYESSDESIITVNEFGHVTAVAKGSASVLISVDGQTVTVNFDISQPSNNITIYIMLGVSITVLIALSTVVYIKKRGKS